VLRALASTPLPGLAVDGAPAADGRSAPRCFFGAVLNSARLDAAASTPRVANAGVAWLLSWPAGEAAPRLRGVMHALEAGVAASAQLLTDHGRTYGASVAALEQQGAPVEGAQARTEAQAPRERLRLRVRTHEGVPADSLLRCMPREQRRDMLREGAELVAGGAALPGAAAQRTRRNTHRSA
jgi:hypothetical protein